MDGYGLSNLECRIPDFCNTAPLGSGRGALFAFPGLTASGLAVATTGPT